MLIILIKNIRISIKKAQNNLKSVLCANIKTLKEYVEKIW